MMELHAKPNEPWYARVNADGEIELNPADPQAEEKLKANHEPLFAVLNRGRGRKNALRKARRMLRKLRLAGLPSQAAEIDAVLDEINGVEPDVAE